MSEIRTFLVYFELENSGELAEPRVLQLPEHLWRFSEFFQAELKSEIPEMDGNFKMKYNSTDGAILKIRGAEDYEHFSERLENSDENEEIVIILERIRLNKNGQNPVKADLKIYPSELQRGKCVGNGMHATVRMGFHEKTQKWYVIKTILSQNNDRNEYEKEILAYEECSKSAYVVGYHGCEVSHSKKELVLEYMDRGDLRPFGALPFPVHLQVAVSLIRAIRDVWNSGPGYIHRDIKPENILCNSQGHIKICDFGAAKRIDNTYGIASSAAGTQLYQAPEQQMGHDYSEKVDIWCFGLTLWELAIGPNLEDNLNGISPYEEIIVERIDGFPDSLTLLIANCVRRDPSDRWNADQIERSDYLRGLAEPNTQIVADFVNKYYQR
ncbi:unnamed protein product [Caenorhabditis sp. 36 PRJEB53466]|nr:unnamed protein product [Caenorhabditis sp. 36 PRJEB53466]